MTSPLVCIAQSYAWGKKGHDSVVAQLQAANQGSPIEDAKPYAELWMGTHPSGSSQIVTPQGTIPLLSHIGQSPSTTLGEYVSKQYNKDLPFLFKVLSVRTALSIQAHPDVTLAQSLHKRFPDVYKDPNHKPEIAIAVTPFKALCKFRVSSEIVEHLKAFPEFSALVGQDAAHKFQEQAKNAEDAEGGRRALQAFYDALMRATDDAIKAQLSLLVPRLQSKEASSITPLEDLMLTLNEQYPNDVGVFSPLVLNVVDLQPGEALFLGPNEPHAYIAGDCVECMATSDNVVRAGLTPKFKDVDTLLKMLTYNQEKAEVLTGLANNSDKDSGASVRLYRPPVADFQVERVEVDSEYQAAATVGPSILLVYAGAGTIQSTPSQPKSASPQTHSVKRGQIFFVDAGTTLHYHSTQQQDKLTVFRATVNEDFVQQAKL